MFKQKSVAALVSLALSPTVFATQTPLQAEEVVVTATRNAMPVSKVLSDVTVITRAEIEETGATQLTELLARQPGMEVTTTGGPGSTASVFLRGANANQTLILVDGMRIVSGTLGTTALQHIPLSLIERVEIVRGPVSGVYGADAIGGVIQIFTRKGDGAPRFHASLGFGENGTVETGAGVNGKVDDTAFGINLSHQSTHGFSAKNAGSDSRWGKHNPDRDGYRQSAYNAYVEHAFAPGHSVTARAFQSFANNEYDTSAPAGGQDELRSRQTGHSIETRNQLNAIWTSTLRYARTQDRNEDFTAGQMNVRSSLFKTTQDEWTWLNALALDAGQLQLGASHLKQQVMGSTAYAQTEKTVKAVFAGYQGEYDKHLWQLNTRYDDDSTFGGKTTGLVGYGYRFLPQWLARVSYGTAFRAPTFNDLYWPGDGNPNLKPENARNLDASLSWTAGADRVSLTWFRNKVEDLIQWADDGSGNNKWKPFNVAQARLEGYTLTAGSQLAGFDVSASATWLDARDSVTGLRLDRRAQRFASANVSRMVGDWTLGGSVQASGQRLDKSGAQVLPGYAKFNLYADLKIDKAWSATARVENVADRDYETAYGYNTAGRTWFVGVRYEPK